MVFTLIYLCQILRFGRPVYFAILQVRYDTSFVLVFYTFWFVSRPSIILLTHSMIGSFLPCLAGQAG